MITFEEAQRLIQDNVPPPREESLSLFEALGCVVAEDILSLLSLPVFDNSAMDGFVLRSKSVENASAEIPVLLKICGAIKAGDAGSPEVGAGEAYRIMTGARVPFGGGTVIPVEKAIVQGNFLCVTQPWPRGKNIRYKGEELKEGDIAVPKNSVVNPGTVGFLSGLGKKDVKVFKKPRLSIIATGSELVPPGRPLGPGKIYDSNSSMIYAAALEMGLSPVLVRRLDDNPNRIRRVVNHALKESEIVILMGGVSVGDTDHVKKLLAEAGVQTVFWKVSQKPGKPMYFGKKGDRLVFGLPGNPASVFTCFYEYVYPAIRRFMGFQNPYLPSGLFPLRESVKADPEKATFLKARIDLSNGPPEVLPLGHQASHMISSLCQANAILVVPPSDKVFEKGDKGLVHALPYVWESGR